MALRMPPLSKSETRKDTAQVLVESGAAHVGRIANIVTEFFPYFGIAFE